MSLDPKKTLVTARGVAVYPRLTEPDTKFKKEGEYSIRLKLISEADEAALIEQLTALYEEAYAENCKSEKKTKLKKADFPWKAEEDKDGNETGRTLFNFKMRASGQNKAGKEYKQAPSIFDAKGHSMNGNADLKIGGGSEVKVAFSVRPFFVTALGSGISLRLQAVQILKLVEWGSKSASGYGFGAEDDGFDSSAPADIPADNNQPSTAGDEDF